MTEVTKAVKTSNSPPKCMWILERGELRSKSKHLAQQAISRPNDLQDFRYSTIYTKASCQLSNFVFWRLAAFLTLWNKAHRLVCFILSMGYKKDIFCIFAYEFELSHNRSLFREIVRLRSRWNNSLRELWNLMLPHQVKLNPPARRRGEFHTPQAYFTLRSNISPTRKGGFSWKRQIPFGICRFLAGATK